MPEKLVRVPLRARFLQAAYKGIPVREAYYTAGYPEGSDERYIGSVNHAETYVLDGGALKLKGDVLLRTGNGFIRLPPEALVVKGSQNEGSFRVYTTQQLPINAERELLTRLGVIRKYDVQEMLSESVIEQHNNMMRELVKKFGHPKHEQSS